MERFFLTRTQNNWIEGPLTQDEVRSRLERGLLTTNDEISAAAGYWFFLHEREEVVRWLGRPLKKLEDEEMTMTMTKTVSDDSGSIMEESLMEDDSTDPQLMPTGGANAPRAETKTGLALAALRASNASPAKAISPAQVKVTPEVSTEQYSVESPSYWKWLVVLFLGLLIFVVYRVFGLPKGLGGFGFR